MKISGDVSVRRIVSDRFEEVVAILRDAFRDYPVMRFILKDADERYEKLLLQLVGYFTDSRFSRDWPVLGVEREGALVAAANISPPQPVPAPPSLEQRYAALCSSMGEPAVDRFTRFAAASARLEPDEPHYCLGMVGALPEHHGHGYGRLLLDAVHAMSAADSDSRGVALSTETRKNLGLYRHFGYQVVGEARIDDLTTWTLYRSDEPG